jgi:type IV pilus assembly protein PilQ
MKHKITVVLFIMLVILVSYARAAVASSGNDTVPGRFTPSEGGRVQGVVEIRHTRASELGKYIRENLLSPAGTVMADDTVRRIFIEDMPENIEQILAYIRRYDVVPLSCWIDCRVIEIDTTDDPDIMVAFEVWKDIAVTRNDEDFETIYSVALSNAVKQGSGIQDSGGIHLKGVYSEILAEFIQYLVRGGKAKAITQHTIKALHGKTAFVSSVITPVSTDNEEKDKNSVPGVQVAITPEVTGNRLILKVKGVVNSYTGTDSKGIPQIATQTAENTVELKEGELCILLGLRQESLHTDVTSTPVLGAIPFLGRMFQKRIDTRKQYEILVQLTPYTR